MQVQITHAENDDAAIVACLHLLSWQASYRGILPDTYLDGEAAKERTSYWARALPRGDYSLVLIATVDGQPAGFIGLKDKIDPDYDALIEHLHVVPDMKGKGIGRRLFAETAALLASGGSKSVCLRVFDANKAAIGFYESLGGITDGHGIDAFAGSNAPDRRIGWRDLAALERACNWGDAP